MAKITLNLAISLDGYICDKDGGYEWIVGHGDSRLDTTNQIDFQEFIKDIDIILMGKNCYDQGFHKDYRGKDIYVATNSILENYDNIKFISGDICEDIQKEKDINRKNVFLFGGGVAIDPFIKNNIIDEYIIGVIPIILGSGRKLFLDNNPKITLKLEEYSISDGITILRYIKKGASK